MKAKKLSIAKLSSEERQAIVDTIKKFDFLHKDMVIEVFSFLETLLEELKNTKITAAILGARLLGFLSEKEKKALQTP